MAEYRRKGCKVNFTNSLEEISIKLIFTKKDKDVDIRDFFSKIKKILDIEIHFKKGQYELIAIGQENVLEMVPKVMENFHHFYDDSFGGSALSNTDTSENVYHFNEQQNEAHKASGNYSGRFHDAPALSQSRLREEKMTTQTEDNVGSSANSDYTFKDDTASSLQKSGNDSTASVHRSNIKTTGTTQGIEQHNTHPGQPHVNEFPNEKPESDEDPDEKKEDLYGGTEMTRSREGEQAEGKHTSHDDDVADPCEDPYGHKSNDENTGIAQGSRGHADSKGLKLNSSTTNHSSMMHENDEDDENSDLPQTVDKKGKPRDDSKGRGDNSNAEEQSKRKKGDETRLN